MAPSVRHTVRLTQEIRDWLSTLDIEPEARASIAVDLADILAAAERAKRCTEELLGLNPAKPEQADRALTVATDLEVQLFTELKSHLQSLQQSWHAVLKRLDELSPKDTGG